MSHGHVISFEGKQYRFPSDATDEEISEQLASISHSPPNAGLAGVARPDAPRLVDRITGQSLEPGSLSERASQYAGAPSSHDNPRAHFNELTSAENLGGWVDEGPGQVIRGIGEASHVDPRQGYSPSNTKAVKQSLHHIISGADTTALPAMPFVATGAPLAFARGAGGAYVGSKAGGSLAEHMGGDPDTVDLSSDIGGLVGGGIGVKSPELIKSPVRGAGRLLQVINKAPDLPTNIPMSPKTNAVSKIINVGKNNVGGLGRRMANVGIPDAPNIVPDSSVRPGGPEPLDSTVRPDAQEHYNDIVPDTGPAPTQQQGKGRIPIWQQAGELQSHIDAAVGQAPISAPTESTAPPSTTTPTANPLIQSMHSSYSEVPPEPTGWPENGRENEPWDSILDREQPQQQTPKGLLPPASDLITSYHGAPSSRVKSIIRQGIKPGADLPRDSGGSQHDVAFSTDNPYAARDFGERYPDSEEPPIKTGVFELHSPSNMMADKSEVEGMDFSPVTEYRRSDGFPKSEIKGLTTHIAPLYHDPIYLPESSLLNDVVNNDPYNRVDEIQSQRPKRRLTDRTGPLGDEGKGGDIGDGDVNSTVGSQSGADSDTQAFTQARSELPNGTLSDHLLRAQEIKEGKK